MREIATKVIKEFLQRDIPDVIKQQYQAHIILIGEKLRSLEDWREECWRKEEVERQKREELNKRIENMHDEIFILKKGRNDAYH